MTEIERRILTRKIMRHVQKKHTIDSHHWAYLMVRRVLQGMGCKELSILWTEIESDLTDSGSAKR